VRIYNLIPSSPFINGFLTGGFGKSSAFGKDDSRSIVPRFSSDNLDAT